MVTLTATPPRLLVVEDEHHIAAGLKLNFELEGYKVEVVGSAREAAARMVTPSDWDLLVLDVMLPDMTGIDLCRSLRESGIYTPVLMLTALDSTDDRVRGLEAGADDYLAKPFALIELLARVRSLLRRRDWSGPRAPTAPGDEVRFGDVHVDFMSHEATKAGVELKLTRLEIELLRYFVNNPGRVITREDLQRHVWQLDNYPRTRMVDNFIMRLRRHFEDDPAEPKHFLSVRGAGYKFVP
jgi:DNA-binding response OmpR family regulator